MQGPQGSVEVFMFSVERLLRNKGNYEYELARFIHMHSPVHEQISEGLTLELSLLLVLHSVCET